MEQSRQKSSGFTLIETMLAITLLALMMGMIYAALNIGMRAWDAGDARVAAVANLRTVEHFLRREFTQIFPGRWRAVPQAYLTFEGDATSLRYVTSRNLDAARQNGGVGGGEGLQWAELALQSGGVLQLKRQAFDSQAQNFDGLFDAIEGSPAPVRLLENVTVFEISYFGAETDLNEPTWRSEWRDLVRLPVLIKLHVETSRSRDIPDIIVAPRVGEEAGCLINGFTRNCGPRPR